MDYNMAKSMFYLETPKFSPLKLPFTPDFQYGAKIEPNDGKKNSSYVVIWGKLFS